MNTNTLKARFCPSPTGLMHVGNVRTALFNALFALKDKGTFLLRIEDTDKIRSERHYAESLMQDLQWLGISWQEGPFWQSERQAIYDKYYEHLVKEGFAYPCFCSEEQLALTRKIQRSQGKPPRYPGTCKLLGKEEVENRIVAGEKPTLRFNVPEEHKIEFVDLVRGEQTFNSNDIGDFIIRRGDGTSPFMFCSVIDDALMGVTHVLRGEDHLTNTPRQLMILRALGLKEPQYGHISLVMGSDGAPLSKRNGSRSVQDLRAEGFLPIAVVNYLARLGHNYEGSGLLVIKELAQNFNLHALGHAPARFEFEQLLYWQKEAIANINDDEFYQWIPEEAYNLIPFQQQEIFADTVKPNVIFPEEVTKWAKILFNKQLDYDESTKAILKDSGPLFFDTALEIISEIGINYKAIIHALSAKLSVSGKGLYLPLRLALTAEKSGPELAKIFSLLGEAKIKTRLSHAANL